ncbi:uncharacterized protein LOC129953164 [Eupeodes corollae]|uniref:uncharacterized protein LOC129953164 n=1 Tax=Eupeodes corollae TaxID=290404 RepID=UPI002490B9B6|nr:uncharacterized protein LOC129953164 [Eupeodes corollae]
MPNLNSQFNSYLTHSLASSKSQWVEKNAKRKNYESPEPHPMPTRFRKPGPMTQNDWQRFNNWVKERQTKKFSNKDIVNGPIKKQPLPKRSQKRMNELANPRQKREKFDLSTSQLNTSSPITNFARNQMNDAVKNGSSLESLIIPKWWFHEESEMNFWRNMRFSVSRKALKYKISDRIENLAKPREFPIKPHCYVPEPFKRVRMTSEQWNKHKKRLEYLSDSNFKNSRHTSSTTSRTDEVFHKIQPQEKLKEQQPLPYHLRIRGY